MTKNNLRKECFWLVVPQGEFTVAEEAWQHAAGSQSLLIPSSTANTERSMNWKGAKVMNSQPCPHEFTFFIKAPTLKGPTTFLKRCQELYFLFKVSHKIKRKLCYIQEYESLFGGSNREAQLLIYQDWGPSSVWEGHPLWSRAGEGGRRSYLAS